MRTARYMAYAVCAMRSVEAARRIQREMGVARPLRARCTMKVLREYVENHACANCDGEMPEAVRNELLREDEGALAHSWGLLRADRLEVHTYKMFTGCWAL